MHICQHFGTCGSCTFQGLSLDQERDRKTQLLFEALASQNLDLKIDQYRQVPLHSRRRATLTSKRTKKLVQVGYMAQKSHQIIPIQECQIISSGLFQTIPFIKMISPLIGSRTALLKWHITECENGLDIVVENSKAIEPSISAQIAEISSQYQIRRLILGSDMIYYDSPPLVEMSGQMIEIPPHPFLQASIECENWLREWSHQTLHSARKVVDLFAGIGTFSYGLSAQANAFEGNEKLVKMMQNNIDRLQLHHLESSVRDLFRDPLNKNELDQFDAAIIDPPRAGAKAQIVNLAKSNLANIVYISCAPESFARDAKCLLDAGWKINRLNIIDQFRFSDHIEIFASFERLN